MAPRRVDAGARAAARAPPPAQALMSEGDGDIEDGLQRQGEERDTRFDAGAEGGDADDGQQQRARDADEDDFDGITQNNACVNTRTIFGYSRIIA